MLWNREIVCVGDGDGVDCRVAVPDREYVFQKDDIIICVLADVEEAYLCLFEKWNSRNLGQKREQTKEILLNLFFYWHFKFLSGDTIDEL